MNYRRPESSDSFEVSLSMSTTNKSYQSFVYFSDNFIMLDYHMDEEQAS